ncbi:hypothetical protein BTO32_06230 [Marinobacter lutaoensis]|uniref:Uncharacterized protein n=1 Tax=Marinobacter lutaoensis TaxID=135739 RepID=A0A1V2DV70_9GAMM|nr:hypothetical protein [Marinobacter lutaoensis]ONF44572.1 hypothetical protein BTO32_06230 [Marinobacter lutaoensis]
MVTISRIQAGHYSVSDGRSIVKQGSGWYILTGEGKHDFGPVTTLASAKEYVRSGSVHVGQHNPASRYGRKQGRKEYNAYLASEAKQGNYAPLILTVLAMAVVAFLIELARQS